MAEQTSRATGATGAMYSPASYAYLGDAVFELLVREYFMRNHNVKAGALHDKTTAVVNAQSQAKMADKLLETWTESELAVYKRGRNTAQHFVPKSASAAEYCKATGLEAVFGWLKTNEDDDRIKLLFNICMEIMEGIGE